VTDETKKPVEPAKPPLKPASPPPLPRKPLAYLEVLFGQNRGRRVPLDRDRLVMGRGEEADFILDDPSVSREHVAVEFGPRGYVAVDLGSANGSRLNGEKRDELVLQEGFTIEVGATVLVMKLGDMPSQRPETTLRNVDTQKLEAIRADTPSAPPAAKKLKRKLPKSRDDLPAQGVKRRRNRAPHPLVAQVVSWLVVLTIVTGGILLILNLLEGGALSYFKKPVKEVSESADDKRQPRPRYKQARSGRSPNRAGSGTNDFLIPAPDDSGTADVAMEKFDKATSLWQKAQYQEALDLLQEISTKYPEFTPPSGTPVQEMMEELKKTISYFGITTGARKALAVGAPEVEILEQVLDELDSIPITDGQFGEEAFLLREDVKSKLKQIKLGFLEGQTEPDIVEQEDVVEELSPQVDNEPKEKKKKKKKGKKGKTEGQKKDLKPEKVKIGSGSDKKTRDKEEEKSPTRSSLQWLSEARNALDAGRYKQARSALEAAGKAGAETSDVKKLESLFSLKLSRLLKTAMDKSGKEPEAALVLVNQALSLARSDSPQEKQGLMLKEQLTAR
jgi:hypothetical protein